MIRHAMALFLGYCLAALFSSSVAMTVSATLWGSAWTWGILIFWSLMGYLLIIPVLFALFLGVCATGFGSLMGVAWLLDKINEVKNR